MSIAQHGLSYRGFLRFGRNDVVDTINLIPNHLLAT